MVHELTKADARRIAVQAQLLDVPRPDDVLEVVRHLTFLQNDPTASVAPSADLVLWSRLGSAYDRAELRDALDEQVLIDHHGLIRPAEDMALYRADMAVWPGLGELRPWQHDLAAWVEANDGCRRDILELLRTDGPLPASAMPDTCEVPWRSSGWNNNKNVQRLLVQMVERGEVATAGRDGREKLWDLAERIYPDDPVPDVEEARRLRDQKRLAHARHRPGEGRPRCRRSRTTWARPASRRWSRASRATWRVDPTLLGRPFEGRAALLSPFDRLVQDRKRLTELFDYEYLLEMYKPVARAALGLLRAPDPARRPAGREARRDGRARRGRAPRRRDPRGRAVRRRDARRGRRRDRRPGALARARGHVR